MTAKSTPGPWHYQEESDAYTHIVRGPTGQLIHHGAQYRGDPAKSDALLIAAAPELLAALERGLEENALRCSFHPQADDPCACCCGKNKAYHWKVDARAAITKATAE